MQAADGAIVHLELAVKFYLGRADLHNPQQHCSDPQHWWGIDIRDTLAHKLEPVADERVVLGRVERTRLGPLAAQDGRVHRRSLEQLTEIVNPVMLRVQSFLPSLVIKLFLFRIRENLVGFLKLLKIFFLTYSVE